MHFGEMLLALTARGGRFARSGWNGEGMYVAYQAGYPDGIAINANTAEATGLQEGTVVVFSPYLIFRKADGAFIPWAISQTDVLTADWVEV